MLLVNGQFKLRCRLLGSLVQTKESQSGVYFIQRTLVQEFGS